MMATVTRRDKGLLDDPARHPALTVGVILAGGLSRRMGGGDKCLMPLGGKPMLAHVMARLDGQVGTVIINANGDPARFAGFARTVVADPIDGFAGPLAGVLAGMRWAGAHVPDARWIVTAAADTPFLPPDLTARLVAAAAHEEEGIALAMSSGKVHPVFGLWPIALADRLAAWLDVGETRKVLAFVDRHPRIDVRFPNAMAGDMEIDPFFNVNTPDDLKVAMALLHEDAE